MSSKLKEWMTVASTVEQKQLADLSDTSRDYLYQLSSGMRQASADTAARIEFAAAHIRKLSDGRLPELRRYDLCAACEDCPYAQPTMLSQRAKEKG